MAATICSPMLVLDELVIVSLMIVPFPTGSMRNKTSSIKIAAIALVMKNTRKTYFNIFPNRFMSTMLATLLLMVKKTRGTTIVYIKFKNTSPNGFKILAFSPRMIPKIQPRRIEQSKMIGKR